MINMISWSKKVGDYWRYAQEAIINWLLLCLCVYDKRYNKHKDIINKDIIITTLLLPLRHISNTSRLPSWDGLVGSMRPWWTSHPPSPLSLHRNTSLSSFDIHLPLLDFTGTSFTLYEMSSE
jgi:hypothetical protein